jgi:hypothetical protein
MKKIKFLVPLLTMALLTACDVFLGPDPDINDPKKVIENLWTGINKNYAYFDQKTDPSFDWNKVKVRYSEKADSVTSPAQLVQLCKDMLEELKTSHSVFYAPPYPGLDKKDKNRYKKPNEYYVKDIKSEYTKFYFGRFNKPNDKIGYIGIAQFIVSGKTDQSWIERINEIIKQLKDTDAIILDVRGNPGGSVENAEYIANRFAQQEEPYCKEYTKNGHEHNDFFEPVIHTIKPSAEETERYTKPVALLTDGGSSSSAEWFTLALRTQPHVTHVGEQTYGVFSSRRSWRLINGWYYSVPDRRIEDIKGNCLEDNRLGDIGIKPKPENIIRNDELDWLDLVGLFGLDESEDQLRDKYDDHMLGRALIWLKQNL